MSCSGVPEVYRIWCQPLPSPELPNDHRCSYSQKATPFPRENPVAHSEAPWHATSYFADGELSNSISLPEPALGIRYSGRSPRRATPYSQIIPPPPLSLPQTSLLPAGAAVHVGA